MAAEAAGLEDAEIARRLVDVDVPRAELVRLSRGLTPARLARVIAMLDPVELMFALKKLRARRAPANQAHVTNLKENPALLAADAAEAAARGFAEVETTVGVSRYAPLNAIAILVGGQTGRPGVLTQCAVEERLNLRLAILGLVTYAETLSVYGTEAVFVDGDDTPWSKAFLASAYASRGVKVRFTSGGGSEALMGESEGKSMLYLEARCLSLVRAAGSQGVQNGSISCIALALSVPGGTREVLAENVLAAWLDLEVASGNDAIASHSEIRKTAKLMGQFLPGTDFVTSGYSSMPRYDNMFGGGNYDSHDYDEWLTIQRDWQVDAGIEPLDEADAIAVRERAARARAGGLRRARLPADHRRGGRARGDVPRLARPARPRPRRRRARGRPRAGRGHQRARRRAGARRGAGSPTSPTPSSTCSGSAWPRTTSRPSAIIDADGRVVSAVNDAERLPRARAPATGSRASAGERLQQLPHAIDARLLGAGEPRRARLSRSWGRPSRGGAAGRGRDRGRPGVRRRARRRRSTASRTRRARGAARRASARRGRCAADRARPAHRRTSRSSATTARSCRARGSRSGSSRRARR